MARPFSIFPDEHGNLRCSACMTYKTPSEFNKAASMKRGYLYNCRECEKERNNEIMSTEVGREASRNRVRKHKLKSKFDMTPKQYDDMRIDQDYSCAICGKDEDNNDGRILAVDHDHITGRIRGLLCQKCNIGLGQFDDSIHVMQSAILYLSQ